MVPCDVQMGISCSAILRYMATAILEDREWRNIESAPDFLNELWIYYSGYQYNRYHYGPKGLEPASTGTSTC